MLTLFFNFERTGGGGGGGAGRSGFGTREEEE